MHSNSQVAVPCEEKVAPGGAVCTACGGRRVERFFEVQSLPVNCIALHPTREAALACATGRIDLGFCRRCGAVSNLAFDPSLVGYDRSYDNSLHFSPTFQRYADESAAYLIDRFDLRGKDIIDVGCGNGEFLAMLCERGGNRGTGFDPSFIDGRVDLRSGGGMKIVRDYYSARHTDEAADLVICRHVLEHIAEPRTFLLGVRAALEGRADTAVFFEVPNAGFVFEHGGIWDVIYEHCFYYTAQSLAALFAACGFEVMDVRETFNGQYLCLEARPTSHAKTPRPPADLDRTLAAMRRFAEQHRTSLAGWKSQLQRAHALGQRVSVWGAGAKGAMFLNAFRDVDGLEYIADVNPHKHGSFIPGTGHQVVSPAFLTEYRPDVLFVMNPNYREEIRLQLASLGLAPELISI